MEKPGSIARLKMHTCGTEGRSPAASLLLHAHDIHPRDFDPPSDLRWDDFCLAEADGAVLQGTVFSQV